MNSKLIFEKGNRRDLETTTITYRDILEVVKAVKGEVMAFRAYNGCDCKRNTVRLGGLWERPCSSEESAHSHILARLGGLMHLLVGSLLGLLLLLDDLRGDSVHIGGALLGQGLSSGLLVAVISLVLDLSNETGFFELLQAVSDDLAGTLVVLGWAHAVSLLATVVGLEGRDSNLASDVELVSNGGSSGVEPVAVVGGEVLETSSLNVLGPVRHLNLVALLEVLGKGVNEFSGSYILNSHGAAGVDGRKLNLNNTVRQPRYISPPCWTSFCLC